MKKKVLLFFSIVVILVLGVFFAFKMAAQNKVDTTEDDEPVAAVNPEKRTAAYRNKDADVSDIKREKGKVNVYMFWGNGCPHCKAQWEYIEELRQEYPNDFNVYGFEVWYKDGNRELLDVFATAIGDSNVNSVPYTIIGDKSFKGAQSAKTLGAAIQEYKNKGIDVYFDKIK